RNKRSVALDLKTEPGKRALTKLVKTADIFIHNMRPEAMKRLGFDYAAVAAIKPDLIYVEAVGYASDGPYAGRQAFDDLIQGASGACDLLPLYDKNSELRPLPSLVADKTCGLFAAIAALAALQHRNRTGEGQYVEVPMLETFTGFILAEHLWNQTYVPATGKFGHPTTITPHRKPYKTKDGYLSMLPANEGHSAKFMELGGIPDGYNTQAFKDAPDGRARVAVYYGQMQQAALSRTTEEWMALCAEHSIPAMRANPLSTVFEDPHFAATGFFETRTLPSGDQYRAMRPGLRFAKSPCTIHTDPPEVGADTEGVLGQV
ncbi:MAG TPA: CoA transferase, partial [Alphaproteobacteria bacterium]|nr:CoA transferase [Alphaproteobacteria bacterium]